jgi:3-oxoacyl-[acyl-carrier-protein] synthase-3
MKGIKIISTGYYVPAKRVENEAFTKIVDTSDEWITSRTGIKARHFVDSESTTDLAYQAALKALDGIDRNQIGVVIVASMTNQYYTPSTACLLQKRLGLSEELIAFDLSAACSGFEYALSTARSLLITNKKPYALVVGAETLSSLLDFTDRSTCVLFGDGAGAAVIGLQESLYYDLQGARGNEEALYASRDEGKLRMQGREVFRFATHVIEECIVKLCDEAKISVDEVDYFVLHQANGRIISHVYKKLKIDSSKFYINLHEYGNTSGASVPLALAEMDEKGMLKRGMKIMLVGFGGGLTYGANLFEW